MDCGQNAIGGKIGETLANDYNFAGKIYLHLHTALTFVSIVITDTGVRFFVFADQRPAAVRCSVTASLTLWGAACYTCMDSA